MNDLGLRSSRRLVLQADALMVILAMACAYLLHTFLRGSLGLLRAPAGASGFILLGYLAMPIWLFLIPVFRLDRFLEQRWSWPQTGFRLAEHHLLGFGMLSAVAFLSQIVVNRSIVVSFVVFSFGLLLAERVVLVAWAKRQHENGHGRVRLLLIGSPGPAMEDVLTNAEHSAFPPQIVGYLGVLGGRSTLPRMGGLVHLPRVLHEQAVDEVVIIDRLSYRRVGWALRVCSDLGIAVRVALPWRVASRVRPYLVSDGELHSIKFAQSTRRAAQLPLKQAFDLVATLVGLVLLSPLLAALALAIRICDGSPVVFSQVRVGLHGRRFRMLKFRTMVRDAESLRSQLEPQNELDGPAFKLSRDPRVTRLGAFLRRTSLDELPQLFNVLQGSMSLVGPRPLPESEQQKIRGAHRRRLSMRPGITGLWQVSGRSDVSFTDWMRMDQDYVDRWSLWLDLRLLLATIPAVLRRRGAK